MSDRSPTLARVLELIEENQRFWSTMGQHVTRSMSQGAKLAAFFRDAWDPWYARVLLISAHDLDEANQAILIGNLADQLISLRDIAGYRYRLPVVTPDGAQDSELAAISDGPSGLAQQPHPSSVNRGHA